MLPRRVGRGIYIRHVVDVKDNLNYVVRHGFPWNHSLTEIARPRRGGADLAALIDYAVAATHDEPQLVPSDIGPTPGQGR